MELFDKIMNTITVVSKEGIDKAVEIKDSAKLAIEIKEREGAIQKLYRQLGKAYFQDHKGDDEPEYEQVKAIVAAFEEIGELKVARDELRGVKRCPECGVTIKGDDKYCNNCGTKCPEEPESVSGDVVFDEEELKDAKEADACEVEEPAEEAAEEEAPAEEAPAEEPATEE